MESARVLRPMGLLEIIDQTFRLYRSDFWLFFGIALVPYLPLGLGLTALLSGPGLGAGSPGGVPTAAEVGAFLLFMVLFVVGSIVATAALTKAVSDRYLGTQELTFRSVYASVLRRILPFTGTMVVGMLFAFSGLILLFVGCIVFLIWISFLSQVFVIEDKRYFAAIWRSRFLIGKGVWAQLAVLMFAINILQQLIQGVIGLVAGIPGAFLGETSSVAGIIAAVGVGLGMALVQPMGQIASVLLYYDSRIRKEGFDLQILAQEMGAQLPPAEPPAVLPPTPEPPSAPTPPGDSSV